VRGARLGYAFVGILALVWAALLVPSMLRAKLESSPIDGVRNFERSMGILASARTRKQTTPGRWIMVPRSDVTQPPRRKNRVIKRRRQNFERLLAAAGITLIAGFIPALRWVWFVHLAIDASLGLYISRLLKYKREELERRLPAEPEAILPAEPEPPKQVSSL
jgi:hypothetical protein